MSVMLLCVAELSPAATPATQPGRPPNILFAIADDWTYGHAGAYGCRWVKTPAFDRVAAEGILFDRAYTPNAKCAPSRASILTGRNPWQLKAAANHGAFFPLEFKSYAEALAEHGYTVGMTAKGYAPGIARTGDDRPRQLAGKPFNTRKLTPPTNSISAIDYAANFNDFLQTTSPDRPWCFWYGGLEPHRGYAYGTGISQGGKKLSDIDRVPAAWPDNDAVRTDMLDYAYEAEHFDSQLGRMLETLRRRGELDNTIVVVTGDNGMPFPRDKGQPYERSVHLPLAIRWPAGIKTAGRRVNDCVSFVDFAPTFIDLAGVKWADTGMAPTAGRSLTDILFSDRSGQVNPARDHVLTGQERHDVGRPHDWGYPVRGIVKGNHLYLRNYEPMRWPACDPETGYLNCDASPTKTEVLKTRNAANTHRLWELSFGLRPPEELYDLKADPDCLYNLAGIASMDGLKKTMSNQMTAEITAQGDPRMDDDGKVFDDYPYAYDNVRGFYERFIRGELTNKSAAWAAPTDFDRPATADELRPAVAPRVEAAR